MFEVKSALEPFAPSEARLLILGSLPGDASLAARRYYAHPRNQFWKLVGAAIGKNLDRLDYPDRLDALAQAHIALWDMVALARRQGSLDSGMRVLEKNKIAAFVATLPNLRGVAFNGGKAMTLGAPSLCETGLQILRLPSSSAANTQSLEAKRAAWLKIAEFLN